MSLPAAAAAPTRSGGAICKESTSTGSASCGGLILELASDMAFNNSTGLEWGEFQRQSPLGLGPSQLLGNGSHLF